MSSYNVIADIGETLRDLIWNVISNDDQFPSNIIVSKDEITLDSPADINSGDNKKLCLFLYHIFENVHLKNQEMININTDSRIPNPLVVCLSYLIIPNTGDKEKDHILLGKVMQIFYDNAILKGSLLQGSLSGTDEEYRITIDSMPFEQVIQLWHSFPEKSFQLALCYQITPVEIDSNKDITTPRVGGRESHSGVF